MTWLECKQAALYKMFSQTGNKLAMNDDAAQEYIVAMPSAANEAMERICAVGKPLRKSVEIEADGSSYYTIRDYCSDFKGFGSSVEVYLINDAPQLITGATGIGNSYLVLPSGVTGTVLLMYDANPKHITSETKDTAKMPLDEDANTLIPIYIAAEVYKDDDRSIATLYMNEFESKLDSLAKKDTGIIGGEFYSVTGWC